MKNWAVFAFVLFGGGGLASQPPNAAELLKNVDSVQTYQTMKAVGTMTIEDSLGSRKTSFLNYARGKDETFMEFTSAAEKGQKILRNAKELYLFFPDAEEVTRLQGAALRQSMAGSDISYEDMTGNRNRSENYTPLVEGSETVEGKDCWKLVLTAKTRNVAYPKQILWIEKTTFLPVRGEYFALSGKLLKDLWFGDPLRVSGRWINTTIKISDKLRGQSSTELRLTGIEIDRPLDPRLFTLDNLSF